MTPRKIRENRNNEYKADIHKNASNRTKDMVIIKVEGLFTNFREIKKKKKTSVMERIHHWNFHRERE